MIANQRAPTASARYTTVKYLWSLRRAAVTGAREKSVEKLVPLGVKSWILGGFCVILWENN